MATAQDRELKRIGRQKRLRQKIVGTLNQPRLCIHRSHKNLTAQVVDDVKRQVIFGMSTLAKDFRSKVKDAGNVNAATHFGELFAQKAKEKGIKKVCFDRGGYLYHGRVKAFAEAARKSGLEF